MNHDLLSYLHELDFFDDQNGELGPPHDFVSTHGMGAILAALKFSLYQRNISNPGGYLRNLVEGGPTGCLHPFIRQRLRGYVPRFEQWLCVEETALLLRWAAQQEALGPIDDGSGDRGQKPRTARNRPIRRGALSTTGCECHDSPNEAYFRDHPEVLVLGRPAGRPT